MAKISERVDGYIEGKTGTWGPRLGNWIGGIFEGIGGRYVERYEPEMLSLLHDTLKKVEDNPYTPAEIKKITASLNGKRSGWMIIAAFVLIPFMIIPMVTAVFQPLGKLLTYAEDTWVRSHRFDPLTVMEIFKRDKTKYERFRQDLRELGVSDDRITALEELSQYIPQAQDIIRFALREVYTPEIARKYGQFEDIPTEAYVDAERAGLPKDTFDKFWAAHWYLPSSSDGFEMMHRGVITEDELRALLKANDVMPYWRDKLMSISWAVPTRVDVRRFWEMRTIDEARLREIYTALGYHGKDLDDYVLWTKIYVDFPDLVTRFKNGWLSLDELKAELLKLGLSDERAEELIQTKVKAAASEKLAQDKDLTRTDILNGVKKSIITRAEGAELLFDMGYDEAEAEFILAINVPENEEEKVVKARELTKTEIMKGLELKTLTADEARGKLMALGYTADNTDFILTLYTIRARELEKADIQTAFKNEAITEKDAIERLVSLGYTKSDAKILITQKVEPMKETKAKEASKADIVAGVKKGLITNEQGYTMLIDLGYSSDAATFILQVSVEEEAFSPTSYEDYKALTSKYKQATGREVKPMTEELKKAADELVKVTKDVEALRQAVKDEEAKLTLPGPLPAEATKTLKSLQTKLYRAEAELTRVKNDYERQVAAWRYSV